MLNAVDCLLENRVFFRTESKAKVNENIPLASLVLGVAL